MKRAFIAIGLTSILSSTVYAQVEGDPCPDVDRVKEVIQLQEKTIGMELVKRSRYRADDSELKIPPLTKKKAPGLVCNYYTPAGNLFYSLHLGVGENQ